MKDDPVAALLLDRVNPKEVPAVIVVLPNNPDTNVVLQNNSSPSLNCWVELLVVLAPI